ncbi:heavy-metal-associated domain-containing protein [Dokdonia sinensis]|uniref:Heavy-metal-associated domain-containing protein n=1 Tax=Dokdonia sinensis TaxID=2479847 RepID=A0A3M0GHH7_9FLAO|nr:cation transporter [Dokdonia sinensis]RMB64140.1 heavy-metal-associated domain-containing protein [Dokdonia sinensis]
MRITLFIQNLKCSGCGKTIVSALKTVPKIESTSVSTENNSVSFNYEEASDLNLAEETLSRLGYPVDGTSNTLLKKATSFVSCAIGRMK